MGHRITRMQAKIAEQLVGDCTAQDIAKALYTSSEGSAIAECFRVGKSSEFYQLIYDAMITHFSEQALRTAENLEI